MTNFAIVERRAGRLPTAPLAVSKKNLHQQVIIKY